MEQRGLKDRNKMNVCKEIYQIGGENKIYGTENGVCRITGEEGIGLNFDSWVRDTFNDHDNLYPGTIISNEAMFCFDEASEIVQKKTGRDKPQRFRTYSHIIRNGEWYCLTKADKRLIMQLIVDGAEMVCLTETGQKHILFKHKPGMWQLDELHVKPDIELLKYLHYHMCELLAYQFSQTEIITGGYISGRIIKAGIKTWKEHEDAIKQFRGKGIFDFTAFMLYTDEKKQEMPEPVSKTGKIKQKTLWD